MGRAFLSARYTDDVKPVPPSRTEPSVQRWDAQTNAFNPDDENIGGHAMVYEAFVVPEAQREAVPPGEESIPELVNMSPLLRQPSLRGTNVSTIAYEGRSSVESDSDAASSQLDDSASEDAGDAAPAGITSSETRRLLSSERPSAGLERAEAINLLLAASSPIRPARVVSASV